MGGTRDVIENVSIVQRLVHGRSIVRDHKAKGVSSEP
jgi:hypothetical protein